MNDQTTYPGNELILFKDATQWKKYFSGKIYPFIGNSVIEVGAGIGETTKFLNNGKPKTWTLLEPDEAMFATLSDNKKAFPPNINICRGAIEDITHTADTIIYIDVLEHIEDDRSEVEKASALLNNSGHLIVLSPAFNSLYSEFDKTIGHYRRYTKKTLRKLTPPGMELVYINYLDSIWFFASVANKFFLHQTYPTSKQINFWDKRLLPISKITDHLFLNSFGKSILAIWRKQA
jgi:2-polyprenyl-3-methyl-5-hydroxy-6-metoxy-1,4-benzoquinol methylase